MTGSVWVWGPAAGLVVAGWVVTFRWLSRLHAATSALGERVARLEGHTGRDGKG